MQYWTQWGSPFGPYILGILFFHSVFLKNRSWRMIREFSWDLLAMFSLCFLYYFQALPLGLSKGCNFCRAVHKGPSLQKVQKPLSYIIPLSPYWYACVHATYICILYVCIYVCSLRKRYNQKRDKIKPSKLRYTKIYINQSPHSHPRLSAPA